MWGSVGGVACGVGCTSYGLVAQFVVSMGETVHNKGKGWGYEKNEIESMRGTRWGGGGDGGGVEWTGVMLGYVSIHGAVRRNLQLVVDVVREMEISVVGLGETDMKGEGLGMLMERIDWICLGTQQQMGRVGVVVRGWGWGWGVGVEGLIYGTFKGDGEEWLLIELLMDGKWVVIVVVYP